MVPREGVECLSVCTWAAWLCLCTYETLCESSRGMSFICVA